MRDLCLMGIFLLCAAVGYFVVSGGRGFLEQMLFHHSQVWYNDRGENRFCRMCRAAKKALACRFDRDGLTERVRKQMPQHTGRFEAGMKHGSEAG